MADRGLRAADRRLIALLRHTTSLLLTGDPMRLVCMHADTVDALKRLSIRLDDLTPQGLWSSEYHLIGLSQDQLDALAIFHIESEDVTPAQLAAARADRSQPVAEGAGVRVAAADQPPPVQSAAGSAGGVRPAVADRLESMAHAAEEVGREPAKVGSAESEVPLAPTRDGGEGRAEPKPDGKAGPPTAQVNASQTSPEPLGAQLQGQKPGKGGGQPVPQAQGRKGQPGQVQGQRYGTTRLRISVAGKYTEATVANGKIVVAGRSFDTPDQAAAELTKSRGDWTFWEYYDSTDGKWRMLTRDWDSVLKSATPGGR